MEVLVKDINHIKEIDIDLRIKICNKWIKKLGDEQLTHDEFSLILDDIKFTANTISNDKNTTIVYTNEAIRIREDTIRRIDERLTRNLHQHKQKYIGGNQRLKFLLSILMGLIVIMAVNRIFLEGL